MSDGARERTNAIARVVAAARAILTYQVGLSVGAARMRGAVSRLQDFETIECTVFNEYMNAVSNLPTGSERLEWSADVLKERDKELERINTLFRDRMFDSARELLERFGREAGEVRKRDRTAGPKP
jgi:hypothetical protein